jgi:hypothetical protein
MGLMEMGVVSHTAMVENQLVLAPYWLNKLNFIG